VTEDNGNAPDAKKHLSVVKSTETTSIPSSIPRQVLRIGTPILNASFWGKYNPYASNAITQKQKEKTVSELKIGDQVKAIQKVSPVYGKVGTIKSFPYDGLAWVEYGEPGEEYGISTVDLEKVIVGSVKEDDNKYDPSMLTLELVELLSRVRMFGAKKYARNNFKITGFKYTRSCAAALRHIFAFLNGEDLDPESGLSHLGHAVASLEHCIYDLKNHPENDDRKS
jgi:hypothetical protein